MLIPLSLSYLSPKTNTTTSHWLVLGKKYWSRDHPLRLRICQNISIYLILSFLKLFSRRWRGVLEKKMRGMGEQFLSGCVYAPENIPHGTHAMLHPYFCILPSNRILIRADLRIQRFFYLILFPAMHLCFKDRIPLIMRFLLSIKTCGLSLWKQANYLYKLWFKKGSCIF